jgi:hypothetical protein
MGYFGNAIVITKSDTIDGLPAWEFMNQTGSLGKYLAGSVIYVGDGDGTKDVNVIIAGTANPVVGDGVLFQNVTKGDILPVKVDYVLSTSTTAGDFIAMRNET